MNNAPDKEPIPIALAKAHLDTCFTQYIIVGITQNDKNEFRVKIVPNFRELRIGQILNDHLTKFLENTED